MRNKMKTNSCQVASQAGRNIYARDANSYTIGKAPDRGGVIAASFLPVLHPAYSGMTAIAETQRRSRTVTAA